MRALSISLILVFVFTASSYAQGRRVLAGTMITTQFELVPNVTLDIDASGEKITTISDAEGSFRVLVPVGPLTVSVGGRNIAASTHNFSSGETITDLQIRIAYLIPPITESVSITADALTPDIEYRNSAVYENTLFGRDDQLVQTLNAGINAGQHEGGGKSLEIRRYGSNLDHGGVGGGLKILVDNVQQNQGTQGHGQGYLGALKSLSPELVESVSIINGPFSAAYGDFSGLGVVRISQKESLDHIFTGRVQGGSFDAFRAFLAYSPNWKNANALIAYEPSRTDGPFINPLNYRRDNITGNATYKFSERQALGFRFNFGRNDFTSSGQIPLDLVAAGELDRFGFIDPENGGKVRLGTAAVYFRREMASGATIKADAFVGRSLFDLFSNFTFFTADPVYGDEIQQHDSRLQEGANLQYLRPYKFLGEVSLLSIGANFHFNQINVGLYPSVARNPNRKSFAGNLTNPDVLLTSANAKVNNYAVYAQNELNLLDSHLRLSIGLRFDEFTFDVNGFELSDVRTDLIGKSSKGEVQPKVSAAYSPFERVPVSFYTNYGRGISSQDARGIIRDPSSRQLSTTDFYQAGISYNGSRFSAVLSSFFIDRSNEQVYIPDDGTVELAGPTRSNGFEFRGSARLNRYLSFNGGLTRVLNAYFRNTYSADGEHEIITSAPHVMANGGLVLSGLKGFNSSLTWRHISNYRLDSEDRTLRASGNDVVDLAVTKRLTDHVDLNFAVDNLLNKRYYETQNYFESRMCGTCNLTSRIHATPGYPFTATMGLTLRFGNKR